MTRFSPRWRAYSRMSAQGHGLRPADLHEAAPSKGHVEGIDEVLDEVVDPDRLREHVDPARV
jgi:hypothetical protein